jgi:hypothetical protein
MNIPERYQIKFLQIMYRVETFLWGLVFIFVNQIHLVYRLNKGKVENITLRAYAGFMDDNISYVKTITADKVEHRICNLYDFLPNSNPSARKLITLFTQCKKTGAMEVINNFDLTILDSIKKNSANLTDIPLADIFALLGVECDSIKITKIRPFSTSIKSVRDLTLDDLYE